MFLVKAKSPYPTLWGPEESHTTTCSHPALYPSPCNTVCKHNLLMSSTRNKMCTTGLARWSTPPC